MYITFSCSLLPPLCQEGAAIQGVHTPATIASLWGHDRQGKWDCHAVHCLLELCQHLQVSGVGVGVCVHAYISCLHSFRAIHFCKVSLSFIFNCFLFLYIFLIRQGQVQCYPMPQGSWDHWVGALCHLLLPANPRVSWGETRLWTHLHPLQANDCWWSLCYRRLSKHQRSQPQWPAGLWSLLGYWGEGKEFLVLLRGHIAFVHIDPFLGALYSIWFRLSFILFSGKFLFHLPWVCYLLYFPLSFHWTVFTP